MKINKIFIVFIVMLLPLMGGCSNANATTNNNKTNKTENKIVSKNRFNEAQIKIVVEKQTNEKNKYEIYNEIKDSKKIQNVKELLNNIKFANAIVDMATSPYYKFDLEGDTKKQESNELTYNLWISPHKDKIELVVDPYGKYVQLSKEKSQKLFQILTGRNLNEA